jgi:hypothetical protein
LTGKTALGGVFTDEFKLISMIPNGNNNDDLQVAFAYAAAWLTAHFQR